MDALRRRTTYKFSEQDNDGETRVLDEQEQDDVIAELRKQYQKTRLLHSISIKLLILLSAIMHITSFQVNPLLTIFPGVPSSSATTLPFSTGFTIVSLTVHLYFAILLHPDLVRTHLQLPRNPKPLPYGILYVISAIGPIVSLLLHLPWQTTAWWSLTPIIVFVVQSAMDAAESSSKGISELESKRYVARGA